MRTFSISPHNMHAVRSLSCMLARVMWLPMRRSNATVLACTGIVVMVYHVQAYWPRLNGCYPAAATAGQTSRRT
eukprot:7785-Heterococcus_DN1.PRE.3